jgi:glucose-6-phosphate 1-dehydrogenase
MKPMQHQSPPSSAYDIVIFGGAGDLSFRKLLPALYMAHALSLIHI